MKTYDVDSTYSQVYVADQRLEPSAFEDWIEEHLEQRHYTQDHIVALCPVSDIVARITSNGPNETGVELADRSDFEVVTEIEIPSGHRMWTKVLTTTPTKYKRQSKAMHDRLGNS